MTDHLPDFRPDPDKEFDRYLRSILQSTTPPTPEKERLSGFLTEYRKLYAKPTVMQKLHPWLVLPRWLPAPALTAFAAVIIVAQGIIISQLLPPSDTNSETYRSTDDRCIREPAIRVVFKPGIPIEDVLLLLRTTEATIHSGPSETGELWLGIPRGRSIAEALALLRASSLVDEAVTVQPVKDACP